MRCGPHLDLTGVTRSVAMLKTLSGAIHLARSFICRGLRFELTVTSLRRRLRDLCDALLQACDPDERAQAEP